MDAWKRCLIGVACSLGACAAHAAEPSAPPPAEAFGNLPAQTNFALSPSGRSIAWADHAATPSRIVILDIAARKSIAVQMPEPAKIYATAWSDDTTLLVTLRATNEKKIGEETTEEWFRTMAIDATTGKGRLLLMADALRAVVTSANIVRVHTSKPNSVLMSTLDISETAGRSELGTRLAGHRSDSYFVTSLFDVDTHTGKVGLIERGTQFTLDWVVDRDGKVVARSEWDGPKKQFRVLAKAGLGWKELYHREDGSMLRLDGVAPGGVAILAIGANGGLHRALWALPLDGSPISSVFQAPDADVDYVVDDSASGEPVGVHVAGEKNTIEWFSVTDRQRAETLHRSFPNHIVSIIGTSASGQQTLIGAETLSSPTVYYIVDFASHKADVAGEEYPALANAALGAVAHISYKARDGMEIPAILTLPPASSGKSIPLVVLPHGGPESRDREEFDWLSQFIATRGYAVLQPQFRGSTGHGEAFRRAGYRQWGRLMQDDVTDGVRAMVERGIADPKRVAIVGHSYGGYAALAGAAFTPDLYKCAISISGVSDLPGMLGDAQRWMNSKEYDTVAYWRENIGVITDPVLVETSPVHAVTAVKIPILLMHGTGDSVVPISQSELMAKELQAAGKNVKYVRLDGEDHWMSRAEDRVRILREIDGFLREHL